MKLTVILIRLICNINKYFKPLTGLTRFVKEDGTVQSIGLHGMCQRKKSFNDQKIMEKRAVEMAKNGKGGVKTLWKISDNSGHGKFLIKK